MIVSCNIGSLGASVAQVRRFRKSVCPGTVVQRVTRAQALRHALVAYTAAKNSLAADSCLPVVLAGPAAESRVLKAKGLPYSTRETDLQEFFRDYRLVKVRTRASVRASHSRPAPGLGTVTTAR